MSPPSGTHEDCDRADIDLVSEDALLRKLFAAGMAEPFRVAPVEPVIHVSSKSGELADKEWTLARLHRPVGEPPIATILL